MSKMDLSGWLQAFKELWQEERKRHPYLAWIVLVVAFIYVFFAMMQR